MSPQQRMTRLSQTPPSSNAIEASVRGPVTLRSRARRISIASLTFHFVLAEVRADALVLRAIDMAGATFDEVWLTRGASTGAP